MGNRNLKIRTADYNNKQYWIVPETTNEFKAGDEVTNLYIKKLREYDMETFPGVMKRQLDNITRMATEKREIASDAPMSAPFLKSSDLVYHKAYINEVMKPYLSMLSSSELLRIESQQANKKGSYRNISPYLLQASIEESLVMTRNGYYDSHHIDDDELSEAVSALTDFSTKNANITINSVQPYDMMSYIDNLLSSTSRGYIHAAGGRDVDVIIDDTVHKMKVDDIIKEVLLPLGPAHPVNLMDMPFVYKETGARVQDTGWEFNEDKVDEFNFPSKYGVKKNAKYRPIHFGNTVHSAIVATTLSIQHDWEHLAPYGDAWSTDKDISNRVKYARMQPDRFIICIDFDSFDRRITRQMLKDGKNKYYRSMFPKSHANFINWIDFIQADVKGYLSFRNNDAFMFLLADAWSSGEGDTSQGGTIMNFIGCRIILKGAFNYILTFEDFKRYVHFHGDDVWLSLPMKILRGYHNDISKCIDDFGDAATKLLGWVTNAKKSFIIADDTNAVQYIQLHWITLHENRIIDKQNKYTDQRLLKIFEDEFGDIRQPSELVSWYLLGRNSHIATKERENDETYAAGDLRIIGRFFNHTRTEDVAGPSYFSGTVLHYGLCLAIKFHLARARALTSLIQNDNQGWFKILSLLSGGERSWQEVFNDRRGRRGDDISPQLIIKHYTWVANKWMEPVDFSEWEEYFKKQLILNPEIAQAFEEESVLGRIV